MFPSPGFVLPETSLTTLCALVRNVRNAERALSTTAMVKPDKARRVEDMLIHAATSGKLGGKVTEGQFVQMLGQVRYA